MKRYKFTKLTKDYYGVTLKQIQAVADFGKVRKGDLGGYIKDESCLPQTGPGWVYPNGLVSGGVVWGGVVYGGEVWGGVVGGGEVWGGEVWGGVWEYSPLQIQGSKHFLNVCDEKGNVQIGCHRKHIDEWLKCFAEVGESEDYTPEQIAEYHDYLKLAKRWIKAHKVESVSEAK